MIKEDDKKMKFADSPAKKKEKADVAVDEDFLYQYLLKECNELNKQMESLLKESPEDFTRGKGQFVPFDVSNFNPDCFNDPKHLRNPSSISGRIPGPMTETEKEEYEREKKKMQEEKELLERQFLKITLEINDKKQELKNSQEDLERNKLELSKVENLIKEKNDFIQFLQEQIDILKTQTE